ncbi:hypothetical protein A6A03_04525 [Chloroflexus islandicus]|uniref:Transposase IS200-like domain-containing protein n=1 Tax=Chloroflexus islandicus TaxID=1707952 RepID=A0A178M1R6_9CHLR|nr:DUF1156 domain-containing protein [Chloroflexus islandicus]OAN40577.1 hypothetical protein A6A03_04525 [Chloroflexus islandicus]
MAKKLIEVSIPLEAINRAAARERSVRQGHPSKLHLWWSRKPLAVCRAVLFASLIDDPDQPGVAPDLLAEIDQLPNPPTVQDDWHRLTIGEQRRQKLFAFIERLIAWESSNDEAVLNIARRFIHVATGGNPPPVYDPFTGGGSIPLEAQRLGLDSVASDLNPVAVLMSKALIELPAPFLGMPPVNPASRSALSAPRAPEEAGAPSPSIHKGWYSRGYLPHFDHPGLVQMITYRLADSVPVAQWAEWQSMHPHISDEDRRNMVEAYLDAGYGSCSLRDERVARLVEENLMHFDGQRYRLLAWVIMPNHVHVLIETFPGYPLDRIVHSWKSYTAKEANKILGRTGEFWQADYLDRYIRDEQHLHSAIHYIHENPVKAGLVVRSEEWKFSSANCIVHYAGEPPALHPPAGARAAGPPIAALHSAPAGEPPALHPPVGARAAGPPIPALHSAPTGEPPALRSAPAGEPPALHPPAGARAAGPPIPALHSAPTGESPALRSAPAGEPPSLHSASAGEPPALYAPTGVRAADPQRERVAGLVADIQYYGQWIQDEAKRRIGYAYPNAVVFLDHTDGAILSAREAAARYPHLNLTEHGAISPILSSLSLPIAVWLWTRTVRCPNPSCGAQMPLVNSFVLSTRKGRAAWAEPVIDRNAKTVQFMVRHTPPPPLEGTVGRNGARCLVCNHAASLQYVRDEGQAGRLGEQLMAIVALYNEERVFLSPDPQTVVTNLQPSWRPDIEMVRNPRHMTPPLYGMRTFDRLFSPRQLLAMTTFSDLIREVRGQILADATLSGDRDSEAYMRTVTTYLAFALDKVVNLWSALTSWKSDDGVVRGTFARQALAMAWVYAEVNPFAHISERFTQAVTSICEVLEHLALYKMGTVVQRDATELSETSAYLFATDPPYYDNIPYADLSDYFYVWLRSTIGDLYPDMMGTLLAPKAAELVADPIRYGSVERARANFEAGMRKAFTAMRHIQHKAYPLTIFYAYKQAEQRSEAIAVTGWETMLASLIGANLMITGTWPVRTERAGRLRETGSNALASSIVLTCRPRPDDSPVATRREFLHALKRELPHALRQLQQGNIAPVDLAQAAIGPGMAVFSRYRFVIESGGDPMTVRTALQIINQEIDAVLVEQEDEFDATTRWAIAWFEQYGVSEGPYGVAETLSKAKNTSVDRMVEAGIIVARSGKVRLLVGKELPDLINATRVAYLSVWEATQYVVRALVDGGEQAAATLLPVIGEQSGATRDLAYRLYTICERHGWAQEAIGYNSLVVAWPDIQRLGSGK